MDKQQAFFIGNCRVEPLEYAIYFDKGEKHNLQPKFVEVLIYLAEQYPKVLSRQELIDKVWQGNGYVGEKALTNAIWHLRQTLQTASNQDVIETIRKSGYRLLVAPKFVASEKNFSYSLLSVLSATPQKRYVITASILILLLLGTVFIWSHQQTGSVNREVSTITTEPGLELFPAPSPDGRYVVYKWVSPDEQVDLYRKDIQQPALPATRLTFDNASEGHSVWSRDGRYLYFSRKDRRVDQCDIVRMDMQRFEEQFITRCPLSGGYYYIDISPDDKTLALYGNDPGAEDSGIYFLDLTAPEAKQVRFSCARACGFKDRDMAFSPDGRSMAVTRRVNQYNENIYLVNIRDGSSQALTEGEEDIVGLTWHPDGKRLVYAVQRADVRSGFMLDLTDHQHYSLGIDGFSYPAFSRQQPWLFYQQRTEQYQISSISTTPGVSSSPFPVLLSGYNHKYPDYSPHNEQIAYVSNESGFDEIWLADSTGKVRKQLTHLQRSARFPKWSHDGKRIAFLAADDDEKGDHIYIVDVMSKRVSTVTSPFNGHNRPSWSVTDNAILSAVFTPQHTDIYLFPLDNNPPQRLTYNGGRYGLMIDDDTLLYTSSRAGLWKKSLNAKEPKALLDHNMFRARYAWTASQQGVYFLQFYNDHQQLMYQDFSTNQPRSILRVPRETFVADSALTLDSHSQRILFTKTDFPQSDIKMLKDPLFR
ncbi:winged helix-turn-helix domain-containing protein [Neptunicella sp. SCSIO 80796]|uniref:winged helix-turn-helix domain-containing protein n=1 Tax=Neptunicella plasticusilytica TaxID=3117012 RepID=UPI003A4DAA1C